MTVTCFTSDELCTILHSFSTCDMLKCVSGQAFILYRTTRGSKKEMDETSTNLAFVLNKGRVDFKYQSFIRLICWLQLSSFRH